MTIFLKLSKASLIHQLEIISKGLENRILKDPDLSRKKRIAVDALIEDIKKYKPVHHTPRFVLDEAQTELEKDCLYISCIDRKLHYRININNQITEGSIEKSEMIFEFHPEDLLIQAELYSYKIHQVMAARGLAEIWDDIHTSYLRGLIDNCERYTTKLANDAGKEANTTEKKLGKLKDFLDGIYRKIKESEFSEIPYDNNVPYFHSSLNLAAYLLGNSEKVEKKKNASFFSTAAMKSLLNPSEIKVRMDKEKLVIKGRRDLEAKWARIYYRLSDYEEQVKAEIDSYTRELCNEHQELLDRHTVHPSVPLNFSFAWGFLGIDLKDKNKPSEGELGKHILEMRQH